MWLYELSSQRKWEFTIPSSLHFSVSMDKNFKICAALKDEKLTHTQLQTFTFLTW